MQKTTMQEHFTLTWSFFSLSRLKKVGFNLLVLQIPKSNPLITGGLYAPGNGLPSRLAL